jgi:hypothetical protein
MKVYVHDWGWAGKYLQDAGFVPMDDNHLVYESIEIHHIDDVMAVARAILDIEYENNRQPPRGLAPRLIKSQLGNCPVGRYMGD